MNGDIEYYETASHVGDLEYSYGGYNSHEDEYDANHLRSFLGSVVKAGVHYRNCALAEAAGRRLPRLLSRTRLCCVLCRAKRVYNTATRPCPQIHVSRSYALSSDQMA